MIFHLGVCTLTAFVLLAVNALLRRAPARLRFAILLIAVLRFAVPTSWLTLAGTKLAQSQPAQTVLRRALDNWDLQIIHPPVVHAALPLRNAVRRETSDHFMFLAVLWALGFFAVAGAWLWRATRQMPRVREANERESLALLQAGRQFPELADPELRVVSAQYVPGALGIWRHQVVLPENLERQLDRTELKPVLAHELAHFLRWDNLTAAIARLITAAFWFHPLMWWMERRLLAERELACDELVLVRGAAPNEYAFALSKVSRLAVATQAGYANITGPNLKQRLELIMSFRNDNKVRSWRGLPIALAAVAMIAPLTVALVNAQPPKRSEPRADALYLEGNLAYSNKIYARAEELFRQLAAEFPGDNRAVFGLAEMAIVNKNPGQARAMLEKQLAATAEKSAVQLALANVAVRTNDFTHAIRIYKPLIDEAPTNSDLRIRLGEVHLRARQLPEALVQFEKARDLDPKNAVPLLKLAVIHQQNGELAKSIELNEAVLKLEPKNVLALNNLAYWKAEQGRNIDEALTHGLLAKMMQPDNADIADTLGWVYLKKGRAADAFKEFRQALLSDANAKTDHPDWRSHLASAIDQGGAVTPERAELRRLLALNYSVETDARIKVLLKDMAQ